MCWGGWGEKCDGEGNVGRGGEEVRRAMMAAAGGRSSRRPHRKA